MAFHVSVDQEACVASGQCVMSAPTVFDQREEDGVAFLLTKDPDPSTYHDIREAAQICPARAIVITE